MDVVLYRWHHLSSVFAMFNSYFEKKKNNSVIKAEKLAGGEKKKREQTMSLLFEVDHV